MFELITLLILSLMVSPALAQENGGALTGQGLWLKNGIVINNSQGRSIRQNPKAVMLKDGSSIIVWEDFRNGYTDIYAQRLSDDGTKLWGDDGVAVCQFDKNQTAPQIILSGSSDAIIAWQDFRNDSADIYAQKVDEDGNMLWADGGVPVCKAPGNQLAPQLCSDDAGGALITWYDYRSGKGEDIYAQRMTSSGTNEWQMDGVPVCVADGTQWYPEIAADGHGGAVICWDDNRNGDYDIYAQRIDGTGKSLWQGNGIPVCAAPENQEYCQIASTSTDAFVITWQDFRNGNADIYAQSFDQTGRSLWKVNGAVVCDVVGNQEKPQIVGDGSGGSVIVWTDFRNGTGNSDIFCQKMSATGTPVWDKFGVSICEAPGDQLNPKIAPDGDGGAVIVWEDQRNPSSSIFARRVNRDGKALWAPDGKTICNGGSGGEFPQVAVSGTGSCVFVWQDKRQGGLDVYAQGTDMSGAAQWTANGVNLVLGFGSVTQQKPKITKTGKDEYVIAWEDYRNGYSNLYAQKVNNKGKLLWDIEGVRVCAYDCDQMNPQLVGDDNGGAILVWEDSRAGSSTTIYAQRLASDGSRMWNDNGVIICQADGSRINPQICRNGKGGAIIAWQDARKGEELYDVFAQNVDKNGSPHWKIDGVDLSTSSSVQIGLKIAYDGMGGAVVTWVEYQKNLNTPDIYAQRINSAGDVIWDLSGLAVCRAPETQRNPDIAVSGEVIIAWEDNGGGNYDIYAQKILKDGTVAWQCDGIPVCTAPNTQIAPKLVLNGDGGATITWEDYRNLNWDIYAQRIDNDGKQVWTKDGVPVCAAERNSIRAANNQKHR